MGIDTDSLKDFCQAQALSKSTKYVQSVTGLSRKQVENIRQGVSTPGGVPLSRWIARCDDFAAAYLGWLGILLPKDMPRFSALNKLFKVVKNDGEAA